MKILVVEPGKLPDVHEVEKICDAVYDVIGHNLCVVSLGRNDNSETYILYCNGTSDQGLVLNRVVRGQSFIGTFVVTKITSIGKEISLTDQDIAKLTAELADTSTNKIVD